MPPDPCVDSANMENRPLRWRLNPAMYLLFFVGWTVRSEFASPRILQQRVFAGGSKCRAKRSETQTGPTRCLTEAPAMMSSGVSSFWREERALCDERRRRGHGVRRSTKSAEGGAEGLRRGAWTAACSRRRSGGERRGENG
jgi:hypothetical protein